MSTFSPSLRIELITTGDQAGVWGNTTNTNLGTLVESAIAGYVSVSITSANQALTALNGAADESRNMTIALTTTTTAAFNVYAPPAEKTYIVYNASAYTATIFNSTVIGNTTAAGAGVAIAAGQTMTVWSDGTNFALQNTASTTRAFGTNNTAIATTAFVQAALQALHPVGSIYMNATNPANPSTYLGFGTWSAFGAGRVPVGFDASNSLFNASEKTGGSYNTTLPSHTHAWSGSSSGSSGITNLAHTHNWSGNYSGSTGDQNQSHTHSISGTTSTIGGHQHAGDWPNDCTASRYAFGTSTAAPSSVFCDTNGSVGYSAQTNLAGAHSHSFSAGSSATSQGHNHSYSGSVSGTTTGASATMDHSHSISVSTSGSNSTEGASSTNTNIQPYITVYMWKRIA